MPFYSVFVVGQAAGALLGLLYQGHSLRLKHAMVCTKLAAYHPFQVDMVTMTKALAMLAGNIVLAIQEITSLSLGMSSPKSYTGYGRSLGGPEQLVCGQACNTLGKTRLQASETLLQLLVAQHSQPCESDGSGQ